MRIKNNFWIIFLLLTFASQTHAQNIRSLTNLELAGDVDHPLELGNSNFDQSVFWRKQYDKKGQQKDSYFFCKLYLIDSVGGISFPGFEFNLMHEPFEDSRRLNIFRKWNIIRIGGALGIEYSPYYPVTDALDYFNAIVYIKYYHISKATRGDKMTQYTRGSWGFLVDGEYKGRILFDIYAKTFPFTIIHFRYKKYLHNMLYYGLLLEFELNENGYKKSSIQSARDIYNGVTLLLGSEYNATLGYLTLNLGLKMDFRNH